MQFKRWSALLTNSSHKKSSKVFQFRINILLRDAFLLEKVKNVVWSRLSILYFGCWWVHEVLKGN